MMHFYRIQYLLLVLCIALVSACDNISESERLIYVKPETARRVVLLEDFTGQRCVNCPRGTAVIEQLQDSLGDALVAVGIHCGPLGVHPTATVNGLATEVGDTYYNHWQLEFQPVGLINRHEAVNYSDWASEVVNELSRPAPLELSLVPVIDNDSLFIFVNYMGTDGNTTGKLQVWVVEDSITAIQMMPDGTRNRSYVHNHVLRQAVNGAWGDDITVVEGVENTNYYVMKPDESWQLEHLSVVAFVYNDEGVQQAVKGQVIGY